MSSQTMGRYCKAFPLSRVEEWSEWRAKVKPHIEVARINDSDETSAYVFIQENYTVTAGIFLDENILFDEVTPEWKDFCESTLGFRPLEAEQVAVSKS
jgi:hypothetical protein